MSPRTGRPPKESPKSASIHIRVTPDEKEAIMAQCKKKGCTCLDLIRAGMEAVK